jgi:hypothetical protein
MNCWAFTPALFSELEEQLREFLERTIGIAGVTPIGKFAGGPDPLKAEFYLPAAVSTMITDGDAEVAVLPTNSSWFGITYREDKPRVTAAIEALVKSGAYPAKLF